MRILRPEFSIAMKRPQLQNKPSQEQKQLLLPEKDRRNISKLLLHSNFRPTAKYSSSFPKDTPISKTATALKSFLLQKHEYRKDPFLAIQLEPLSTSQEKMIFAASHLALPGVSYKLRAPHHEQAQNDILQVSMPTKCFRSSLLSLAYHPEGDYE